LGGIHAQRRKLLENKTQNQDIPIPVKQVVELEVAFEGKSLDEQDKAWRRSLALGLMKHCWPALIDALAKVNPSVSFSVLFIGSFDESIKVFIDKAEELHSILVTQPRAVVSAHPSKGSQKVEFTLNVYWRTDPPPAKRTVILLDDPTRRVVPENAA
jgi:hypothetical protein